MLKLKKKNLNKLVDPQKRTFLSFEIKTIKKIFLTFFFCFSFKKTGHNGVIDGQ